MDDWTHEYAMLALRVDRGATGGVTDATRLIYRGPRRWRERVLAENPPPPDRLADDAGRLLATAPSRYLAAQVRALAAVARRLAGEDLPLTEYARQCLDIDADPVPLEVFEEAHARLDRALPRGGGSVAERLAAWRVAHLLPADRLDLLPALVLRADAETRRRTNAFVTLPPDEVVECRLRPGAPFLAAGHYAGGLRATIFVNGDLPFNLADLLSVVAHEGHPGHIAESMLKELSLVDEPGHEVRFMLGPSFVLSEGLAVHAQGLVFPGDEAQSWLAANVLAERGIARDGSDFAGIHRARDALLGVWANAAHLLAEGRPDEEVGTYLSRWGLLSGAETLGALRSLRGPGMELYTLGYYHGWRLVGRWLEAPDRTDRVRRLLTEQLLPSDLAA
jgi:hypothetical protein